MHKLYLPFLLATCLSSVAANAGSPEHERLFNLLTQGTHSEVKANENGTFYFGSATGVIEVSNSDETIHLVLRENGASENALYADLRTARDAVLETQLDENGLSVLKVTDYSNIQGAKEIYSTTEFKIQQANGLSIAAEKKTFWKYERSADLSQSHYVRMAQPELETLQVDAPFVLSLNDDEMAKMGQLAADHILDSRHPERGDCSMQSPTAMSCSWSLPTDYTPDTLEGTFSIQGGKIERLIDATLEYGC